MQKRCKNPKGGVPKRGISASASVKGAEIGVMNKRMQTIYCMAAPTSPHFMSPRVLSLGSLSTPFSTSVTFLHFFDPKES